MMPQQSQVVPWAVAARGVAVNMGGLIGFFALVRVAPWVIEVITGTHVPTALEAGLVRGP